MSGGQADAVRIAAALLAIAAVTVALGPRPAASPTRSTVSTTYLMVVLLVAATSRLRVAVVTSVVAMLCLNFFFLPPVGTFTIADPQNWVALFAFLAVSLVASHLSAVAQARTREALDRRDELARLFDLGRDVLMMTDSREALSVLARSIARRFDLEFVAVALPRDGDWDIHRGRRPHDRARHARAVKRVRGGPGLARVRRLRPDLRRPPDDRRSTAATSGSCRCGSGTRPIGILAAAGRPVEPGTLETLGRTSSRSRSSARTSSKSEGRRADAAERAAEDRAPGLARPRPADAADGDSRRGQQPQGARADRRGPSEQSDLILSEVERLTRLFENILEMARIDAGAVATEARWAHPSEIVAAAREQVEQTLRRPRLEVSIDRDVPVQLDPRLTATALAHLLENAGAVRARGLDHPRRRARDRRGPGRSRSAITARASRRPICRTCSSASIAAPRPATRTLRHRHGPVDCPRAARGGARPGLGGELPGRRRRSSPSSSRSAVAANSKPPARRAMTDRPRILLVDDEVAIQRAVAPLLRSRGYDVEIAGTGAQALASFAERAPDLVVLDLGLAGHGGHRGLPPDSRDVAGADHRAVGARRRGRQGERARPRRRRLRDQAVRPGGTAGAHPRRAAACRAEDESRRAACCRAGDLTIDYDRRRVVRRRDRDPADAEGVRAAVAAGAQPRSGADPPRDPQGDLGAERGGAAGAPVDAGRPAAKED